MVLPCPACGDVRFSWGPEGPPQRRCWACGHLWEGAEAGAGLEHDVLMADPTVRAALEKLEARVVRPRRRYRRPGAS